MLSTYISVLKGSLPVPVQSFWKHLLRYRLLHLCAGMLVLGGVILFLLNTVTTEYLHSVYGKVAGVVDTLYPLELEVSYDPVSGVATNMSGPVVWTTEQVFAAITPYVGGMEGWPIDGSMSGSPKNMVTIDTTATVEDFVSYDTMMLVTQKYLIAQSTTDMRIVPLISKEATTSTGIVITKELLTTLSTEGYDWVGTHESEIRSTLLSVMGRGGLLLLPFLAIGMTAWLSVGMLLVTLVSWLLSKIRVRVSYQQLFTWLSLSYLPVYLILKILTWSGILPGMGIIGYLAMVACLAVFIVRIEEKVKS